MLYVLAIIPIFCIIAAVVLYPHNAKRQFLRMDLVQFVYAMVIFPLIFVWAKSLFYTLLRHELDAGLSQTELFALDSLLSLVMLYMYAFVTIHALTKSFNMRYFRDPLYDIFEHSEWFHLWLSHLVFYAGTIVLFSILSITNAFVPAAWYAARWVFWLWVMGGGLVGLVGYAGIWLSDPKQGHLLRVMKLLIAAAFTLHVVVYYSLRPGLIMAHGFFWGVSSALFVAVVASFLFERSTHTMNFFERFKHDLWEESKLFVMKKDR